MSEKGKKKKKSTGLGIAIWILAFLIILIVFLVKQEDIKNNFDKSGASALIEKKIGKDIFEKKDSPKNEDNGEIVIDLTKNSKKKEPVAKSEPKKMETVAKTEPKKEDSAKKQTDVQNQQTAKKQTDVQNQQQNKEKAVQQKQAPAETKTVAQTQTQAVQTVQPNSPAPQPVANTIKAKICFVAIDSDGPVVRKEVTRSVEKDSPMGDALRMLLAGPSATEAKTGCRSLIPEGTRLLSASVKNGIANLNFSEEFQFNQFGAEGSIAQLMQVVYTATNFSTVKGVQILIEGQKRDYLTEGVWIGSPLNRSSF